MALNVPHHEEGENEEGRLHQQEQDPDGEGEGPQLAATAEDHLELVPELVQDFAQLEKNKFPLLKWSLPVSVGDF